MSLQSKSLQMQEVTISFPPIQTKSQRNKTASATFTRGRDINIDSNNSKSYYDHSENDGIDENENKNISSLIVFNWVMNIMAIAGAVYNMGIVWIFGALIRYIADASMEANGSPMLPEQSMFWKIVFLSELTFGQIIAITYSKSRQKQLDKMIADGLIEPVDKEAKVSFRFPTCDKLSPPVMAFQNVGFSYSGDKQNLLYKGLEFGIDLDSRIALVGPNGTGKSTLLKLMCQEISPTIGNIQRHSHLRIARYHQHSEDQLDPEMSPLEYMQSEFKEKKLEIEAWRQQLGRFGITGKSQTVEIKTLSDGQKSRIVFCWLAQKTPHLLLFDEPTNHLDMEAIDALAEAIKAFE
eukprot:Pgem_evm1s15718